ncbi:hypothetical protein ACWD4E_28635, partial [Streptomyces sp. NPDC002540]
GGPEAPHRAQISSKTTDRKSGITPQAITKRPLRGLEGMDADDPEFIHLFVKLRTEVRAHVKDEEGNLFIQLRAACGPEVLDLLGQEVRMAKETAPTRPHPGAPSSPLASKILSPGLGLVDRVRDFITGRGE